MKWRLSMEKYLLTIASEIGIELSKQQLHQFRIYFDYLLEVNKVMNLTAITETKEVVQKHFIDSISVINYFDFIDGYRVIDVGTGAGFPGIPLAIMLPKVQFTLMDSLNKRIKFLDHVVEMCELENVICVHSRAEDLGRNVEYREKFDVCISRAVANLSVLLEYCIPFVKTGGIFISYKSVLAENELIQSENAQKILQCQLKNNISFELADSDYKRCFLLFEKKNFLSKKYPRQSGVPKKNPL